MTVPHSRGNSRRLASVIVVSLGGRLLSISVALGGRGIFLSLILF